MKRIPNAALAGVAALVLCVPSAWASELPVHTHDSIDEAMAAAAKSGKVVMVDVNGRPWCDPCNAMGRNVLDTPEFRQWARESVEWVEITVPAEDGPDDAERVPVWQEVMRRYGVQGLPTILVLDDAREEVARMHGGPNPEVWIEKAEQSIRQVRKPNPERSGS